MAAKTKKMVKKVAKKTAATKKVAGKTKASKKAAPKQVTKSAVAKSGKAAKKVTQKIAKVSSKKKTAAKPQKAVPSKTASATKAAKKVVKKAPKQTTKKAVKKAASKKVVAKKATKKETVSKTKIAPTTRKTAVKKISKKVIQATPQKKTTAVKVESKSAIKPKRTTVPEVEVNKEVKRTPVRMSPEDLAYFEKLLMDKRATLVEELGQIEDANLFRSQNDQGGELAGYSNHLADAASDYTTLETNFELAEREGKYLVYIEEALERVKRGTYGICKICEGLIPKARLEVVPTATKCVNCKQQTKKREALEQQKEMARQTIRPIRRS